MARNLEFSITYKFQLLESIFRFLIHNKLTSSLRSNQEKVPKEY